MKQNKENKEKQKRNHAGGSMSYAPYHEELFQKNDIVPSRGEVWRRANQRVDGSWKSPHAEAIVVCIVNHG